MGLDIPRRLSINFSSQPHRWRRFLPYIAFVIAIGFIQFIVLTRNPYFLKDTFKSLAYLSRSRNQSNERIHVLLISYARTGSSFVGDMLQSLPDTFYHFEPLHFMSNPVLNNSFEDARALLGKIYKCNVSSIEGFLPWQKQHQSYMKFKRSFTYWKTCSKLKTCYDGTFIDSYCRNHRLTVVKTIRFRLKEAADMFIKYPNLNLKIIYLSRDPRGALNSRKKFPVNIWCKRDPMCSNHKVYCSALDEDLQTVCTLSKERRDDFMVMRYEDLSLDPFAVASRLTRFLGFSSVPEQMTTFLQTHTAVVGNIKEKSKIQGVDVPYSTFRNSSVTAMSWRQQMSFQQLVNIQESCHNALKGLGYYSYVTLGSVRSNINFDINLDEAMNSFCSMK